MRKFFLTVSILGVMIASANAHGHGHGHHKKWYKKRHHHQVQYARPYARPVIYQAPPVVHVAPPTPVVYQPAPVIQPRGVYFNVGGTL